jgi:biotin transport system substrate-specific component
MQSVGSAGAARQSPLALLVGRAAIILVGGAVLALSAKLKVPFWPVPMTMGNFTVLALGLLLGPRMAAATVVAYLAEGAAGLPVFASGSGIAYMMGPTGGYLLSYPLAAYLTGWLAQRGSAGTFVGAALVAFAGDVVVFVLGVGWLASLIGLPAAIAGGLVPFLLAEALKIGLLAVAAPAARATLTPRLAPWL